MKLIRFGNLNEERPGLLTDDGRRIDLSGHFEDWNPTFFRRRGLAALSDLLAQTDPSQFAVVDEAVRHGSPVARPGKVICVGLNYSDHAAEAGMALPKEPILFMKGSNTVVGPYDNILIPRRSTKTDWEVELGIIIGKDARYLNSVVEAPDYIAGYCVSHDVSEREFQLERGGQWTKGKSCDTFNPLGPALITPEEIPDVRSLAMSLSVNGERRQSGNTGTMIFDVYTLVYYISQFMTLEAGDLISTGTPPGVGMGMKPPQFLKAGDIVELSIDGLGSQRQVCMAEPLS
ncbi:MAG TPA: fumarylacetoacetate hydrolase family protein [Acidisarcina sp.]|nr:fumarylacetoacetate hydrolase family protein [Acidisarcina sp.]